MFYIASFVHVRVCVYREHTIPFASDFIIVKGVKDAITWNSFQKIKLVAIFTSVS